MDHRQNNPPYWYYYDFGHLEPGRYYCGDSFQLLPAVESESADMVLIDPPYGMDKDKTWDTFAGKADYLAFSAYSNQTELWDFGTTTSKKSHGCATG